MTVTVVPGRRTKSASVWPGRPASPVICTDSAADVLTSLSVSADRPSLEIHSSSRAFDPVRVLLPLGRRQPRVEHGDVTDGAVGAVDRGDLFRGLRDLPGRASAQRQTCRGEEPTRSGTSTRRGRRAVRDTAVPLFSASRSRTACRHWRRVGTAWRLSCNPAVRLVGSHRAPPTAASGAICSEVSWRTAVTCAPGAPTRVLVWLSASGAPPIASGTFGQDLRRPDRADPALTC